MRPMDIAVRSTTTTAAVSLGLVLAQLEWIPFPARAMNVLLSAWVAGTVVAGQCWHARASKDAQAARDARDELLLLTIANVTRSSVPRPRPNPLRVVRSGEYRASSRGSRL